MNQKTLPIIIVLLVIASFCGGYWVRGKSLNISVDDAVKPTTGTTQVTPAVSATPLSVDNLKIYAKALGMDANKFNSCLDDGAQAGKVAKDTALADTLGVSGTPAFFVNGKFLGGAFPLEAFKDIIDKELAGTGSSNASVYSAMLQQAAVAQQGRPAAFNPKPVKVEITADDPQMGPSSAKITIVEFSDFQCPYCERGYQVMEQVLAAYKDQIHFVYKQLPLVSIHPYAQKAGEASLCAQQQGKFWEYYHKLFSLQSS